MNFAINFIQHIGIPATDIKTSEAFYQKLGFSAVMNASFDFKASKGTVTMMQQDNMIIELYQLPDSELEEIKVRKDGHIDHIAFDVSDIDQAFKELKEDGFHILDDAPVYLPFWKNGCRYFNILGPAGERLEFNQIGQAAL